METHIENENTSEENIPLYSSDQDIYSEESDEESDTSWMSFNELPDIELFEFSEENYINAQIALEKEVVDQLSDESEDFEN